jgi:hypothetical protein
MNVKRTAWKAACSFWRNDRSPKRKTDVWEVWRLCDAAHVGQIRWYSRWRRYCFFPTAGTMFDADHLGSISQFLDEETAAHRKGKRAFREVSA